MIPLKVVVHSVRSLELLLHLSAGNMTEDFVMLTQVVHYVNVSYAHLVCRWLCDRAIKLWIR